MDIQIEPYLVSTASEDQIKNLVRSIRIQDHQLPANGSYDTDLLNIKEYYLNRNGNFWVAMNKDRVLGTIAVIPVGDELFVLRKMFVDPEFRGAPHYLAKQLLDVFMDYTLSRGAKTICLGTSSSYVRANGFYLKHGFTKMPDDQFPAEFKNPLDDIFYQKVIK